jgi:hypothetical protein
MINIVTAALPIRQILAHPQVFSGARQRIRNSLASISSRGGAFRLKTSALEIRSYRCFPRKEAIVPVLNIVGIH